MIDELIHQFSDPFAFCRELVQNGIDSGSSEVDISVEYQKGVAEIVVQDFGEGMTREIIETRLVRMFSSTKEQDLTKIGRFGIGFISVLAIDPDEVVLETGREGQYWKMVLKADKTYELYRLSYPLEGTTVRLRKTISAESYGSFVARLEKSVRIWCRFVQLPVYFNGEDIRRPFDLQGEVKYRAEERGTRIVMSMVPFREYSDDVLRAGYFNRGLTLVETSATKLPWVRFLIDSPALEHTVTRDALLRDEGLREVNKQLLHIATRVLPERILRRLEEENEEVDQEEYSLLMDCLTSLVRYGGTLPPNWEARKIFRSTRGLVSYEQIEKLIRIKRVKVYSRRGPILEFFRKDYLLAGGREVGRFLENLTGQKVEVVDKDYLLFEELARNRDRRFDALSRVAKEILDQTPLEIDGVFFWSFQKISEELKGVSSLVVPRNEKPIPKDSWRLPPGPGKVLVLNRDPDSEGDSLDVLLKIFEEEPEFAALCALELTRMKTPLDLRMVQGAQKLRQIRSWRGEEGR